MGRLDAEFSPLGQNDESINCDDIPPIITAEGDKKRQYLAAIATTIGAFSIGTVLAWTSPALPILSNNATTLLTEAVTPEQEAWVGSLVAIGAIVGSIPTGLIADSIGRKWTIILMCLPFIISSLLIIFGRHIYVLYAARVLSGISCGGFSVVSPMYVGEISEVSIRGALGSYFEVLLCLGVMVVYLVGAVVDYIWLAILMCIPPSLCLFIFMFMPDTPVYYLQKGREAEAKDTLQYFRGVKYNILPEIKIFKKEIEDSRLNAGSWRDLISSRANVNSLIIAVGLMFFQQMSGVNIVIFYTSDIFRAAGSNLHPDVCAVIIGSVQALVTYISLLLVDKAGRRVLLFFSGTTAFLCLVILGAYFYVKDFYPEYAAKIGWLPLITISVFIIGMAIGFGPVPWLMMSEVFSSKIKGVASSVTCIVNWFLVFFVTKTYVNFVGILGTAGAFWFYAGITAFGLAFIFFKVPETKGKTFLEIQGLLAAR